ncbi:glycosyltransferase [Vibrio breoganii]
MSKKIAIVDSSLGPGGAEKLIVDMAPEFQKKGNDTEIVIFTSYNDTFSPLVDREKVKLTFLGSSKKYWDFSCIFKLWSILKNKDIIYTHVVHAQYFVAFLRLFLPKKVILVTTEHNTHNRRRGNVIFKLIDRWVYSKYDKIISITDAVEDNLLQHLNEVKSNKFNVVPNGICIDRFRNARSFDREKLSINNDDFVMIMVGRFAKAKDQKTLIEALTKLPERFKLVFIGDGLELVYHKELVLGLGLDSRVVFIERTTEVPEILKMSNLGILSSHWEGLPLAALEIMASGLPFLGSNVPGIRDLITDDDLLFSQGDVDELVNKIVEVESSEYILNKNVASCNDIVSKYSVESMANSYLSCVNYFDSV